MPVTTDAITAPPPKMTASGNPEYHARDRNTESRKKSLAAARCLWRVIPYSICIRESSRPAQPLAIRDRRQSSIVSRCTALTLENQDFSRFSILLSNRWLHSHGRRNHGG